MSTTGTDSGTRPSAGFRLLGRTGSGGLVGVELCEEGAGLRRGRGHFDLISNLHRDGTAAN